MIAQVVLLNTYPQKWPNPSFPVSLRTDAVSDRDALPTRWSANAGANLVNDLQAPIGLLETRVTGIGRTRHEVDSPSWMAAHRLFESRKFLSKRSRGYGACAAHNLSERGIPTCPLLRLIPYREVDCEHLCFAKHGETVGEQACPNRRERQSCFCWPVRGDSRL